MRKVVMTLPAGFSALLLSAYFLRRHARRKQFEVINDPEFTGFKCALVPPPYNNMAHTGVYCALPTDFMKQATSARNMLDKNIHPLDVFVASYPKSGTAWLSEVVYLLVNRLDWKGANESNLEERVPYFEYIHPGPRRVKSMPVPRVIKTHLPFTHLPERVQNSKAARVIYIVRDPRDVVVSYYHFTRCLLPSGYRNREGIEGFTRRFLKGTLPYCPWSDHVNSYSCKERQNNSENDLSLRVLIIRYEEMKTDPAKVIRRIENFLHQTWSSSDVPVPPKLSEDELVQLVQHCSFESMKANPQTNYSWYREAGLWIPHTSFMRSGTVGSHHSDLSPEQASRIAQMAQEAGLGWTLADMP